MPTIFKRVFAVVFYFGLSVFNVASQNTNLSDILEAPRDLRLMFYNCENYFDVEHDSLKSDEEYLPSGERHWNESKYYKKTMALSKVIAGVGAWSPVDIVGLCEVENHKVLDKLVKHTPLYKYNYNVVHKESPDQRGIDVALLYREDRFTLLAAEFIPVVFSGVNKRATRDVLYVKGQVEHDTLHVFVNHWPSRWGGQLESEGRRVFVANIVRSKVDSILNKNILAKIVIMGDLNDEPHNVSVKDVIGAEELHDSIAIGSLYNLMYPYVNSAYGTLKYQGKWGILDHLIVSGSLLKKSGLYTNKESATIYYIDPLLTTDDKYLGLKPFRTYVGFSYKGGFSDHLPVFMDFYYNK